MRIFNGIASVSLILIYYYLCIKPGRDMWMLQYSKILCYPPLVCLWMAPVIQTYIAFNNESLLYCCFHPNSKILSISQIFHPESTKKNKSVFLWLHQKTLLVTELAATFSERSEEGQSQVSHLQSCFHPQLLTLLVYVVASSHCLK